MRGKKEQDLEAKLPNIPTNKSFFKRPSTYVIGIGLPLAFAGAIIAGKLLGEYRNQYDAAIQEIKKRTTVTVHHKRRIVMSRGSAVPDTIIETTMGEPIVVAMTSEEKDKNKKKIIEEAEKVARERTLQKVKEKLLPKEYHETFPKRDELYSTVKSNMNTIPTSVDAMIMALPSLYESFKSSKAPITVDGSEFMGMINDMKKAGYPTPAYLKSLKNLKFKSGYLEVELDKIPTVSDVNAFTDIEVSSYKSKLKAQPIGNKGVKLIRTQGKANLSAFLLYKGTIDTLWLYPFKEEGKMQWWAGVAGKDKKGNDIYIGLNASTMAKLSTKTDRKKFKKPYQGKL